MVKIDQRTSSCLCNAVVMISWIEHLRCPKCRKTGDAELYEISQFNNGFRKVPDGFKVIVGEFGSEFYCATCDIPLHTE